MLSFLNNIRMKPKMVGLLLCVGIVPLLLLGFQAYRISEEAMIERSYDQLRGVREIKRAQIEKFFAERQGDMDVLVETVSTLRAEAFRKLEAIRETKRSVIEGYFSTIDGQIRTFSNNGMIVEAMQQFSNAFPGVVVENSIEPGRLAEMKRALGQYYSEEFATEYRAQNPAKEFDTADALGALPDSAIAAQYYYIQANENPLGQKHLLDRANDASQYSQAHGNYHPIVRDYLENFGYYDIFLANHVTGEIVYSVFKELDFGTSLLDGPYADTNFGEAFRLAQQSDDPNATFLVDYQAYPPSYEAAASFIASPIFDGDKKIGVALFQMPIDRLNEVMSERSGLGETGETYLVGADKLMRSDSYLATGTHSVLASFRNPETGAVDTVSVERALAGESGAAVIQSYNGNPVLSAFAPVHVGNHTWSLLAEIDVAEAFSPQDEDGTYFYEKYAQAYGYYDLFLTNPDGYCFYTVGREPDYQSNFLTGEFRDSGMGELIREVLETKAFGMADFAPYAPSGGVPAAFIAQPVVSQGDVEVIVALQLSLESINHIMQRQEGMGKTGETYLVGGDLFTRSDIVGKPDYSVQSTFGDARTVDTEAAKRIFSSSEEQRSGEGTIENYLGQTVFSSYTPVQAGALNWGLIAEIGYDEVYAPMRSLRQTIVLWVLIIGLLVSILAYVIAMGIVAPLLKNVALAEAVASGDLTSHTDIDQKDEVGVLAKALNDMAHNLRGIMMDVSDSSNQLNDSSGTVADTSSEMSDTSEKMSELASTVAAATEQASANLQTIATAVEQISTNSDNVSAGSEEVSANLSTVSAAVEEMSANMHSIASAVEQMTASVNAVATAAEEMSASLAEVASNTDGATKTADHATAQSRSTMQTVNDLGQSASEISQIVELITGIAAQTNLLALNATIEAASAGEAGKGFAVVASEVKELARQTAKATEQIATQVANMQSSTGAVTHEMGEVVAVIEDMRNLFENISASVHEQSKAITEIARNTGDAAQGAQEVSRNVQEAAMGASEVSRNVQEASGGASEIVKNIAELAQGTTEVARNAGEAAAGMNEVARNVTRVSELSQDTKRGADQVRIEAQGVSNLSTRLSEMVAKFKIK